MIKAYLDKKPQIHSSCYIAENAAVIGDVTIGENSSVWFGAVIRGDINEIQIGRGTNIQDNCTIHVNSGEGSVRIGEYVTIGHNVVLHGCRIGNNSLIGMGAIVLDNAVIGENTIIGAGSLVTSNKVIPSGVLCIGSPAKVVRELTDDEIKSIRESAEHYMKHADEYK